MKKSWLQITLIGLVLNLFLSAVVFAQTDPAPEPIKNTSVEIISVPKGAMVHIDGEKKGLTPLKIKGLTIGDHAIKLHKQGYQDHEQTLTLSSETNQSLGVELYKLTKANIKSKPKGATVYLDEKLIGTTPLKTELATGNHKLEIKMLGYADWSQEVIILEDYSNKVSLLKLYQINFNTDPPGAEVYMDNKYLGDTPFTGDYTAGKHLIKLQLDTYQAYEKQIKLKKNLSFDADLKKVKEGGGLFKKTLFLAALVGGGYYYYITYVDIPEDAGFPNPPSRP